MVAASLQLDAILDDTLAEHAWGHKLLESIGHGVEHALPDVVGPDVERHAALREIVAIDGPHVLALLVAEQGQVHLGHDGEPAVLVDDMHQRVYAASLVDVVALGAGFTERERTVAETLRIAHHPHVLVLQIGRLEDGQLAPAALCQIDIEPLGVEGYLEHSIAHVARDGDACVELTAQQGVDHVVSLELLDRQLDRGKHLAIMADKPGQDVGRYGGAHGEGKLSAYAPLVLGHNLGDAVYLCQSVLCLAHYLLSCRRGHHAAIGALKDARVEFFLQLLQHGAERGLRDMARLGRLRKVAKAVDGDNVS